MAEIRFWDLPRSTEFPADVVQCSECCALVLDVNAGPHADWHEQITEAKA